MSSREILRYEKIPVFQNKMFDTRASALNCPTGNVVLAQDMTTGLIRNEEFDPGLLEYDADYQNEQACSFVFKQHLDSVSAVIAKYFLGKSIAEIGCGKGYFLEHLQSQGYDIFGVDPAYQGQNPRIIKKRFSSGLGLSAEGVVLRHVLEHVVDPVGFLRHIAEANSGRGLIYIEVPCFDWISRHRAWFDVFYEHVNYFRLPDFYRIFGTVLESGRLFGGQYIYVVADLAALRAPQIGSEPGFELPGDFFSDRDRVSGPAPKGTKRVIWGGAAKGMMFALLMKRSDIDFDFAIDINPAKQGKYLAGTGLQVQSPEHGLASMQPEDMIFVMNSNYFDEIVAMSDGRFRYFKVGQNDLC